MLTSISPVLSVLLIVSSDLAKTLPIILITDSWDNMLIELKTGFVASTTHWVIP